MHVYFLGLNPSSTQKARDLQESNSKRINVGHLPGHLLGTDASVFGYQVSLKEISNIQPSVHPGEESKTLGWGTFVAVDVFLQE